jgi:hypothetical protein
MFICVQPWVCIPITCSWGRRLLCVGSSSYYCECCCGCPYDGCAYGGCGGAGVLSYSRVTCQKLHVERLSLPGQPGHNCTNIYTARKDRYHIYNNIYVVITQIPYSTEL